MSCAGSSNSGTGLSYGFFVDGPPEATLDLLEHSLLNNGFTKRANEQLPFSRTQIRAYRQAASAQGMDVVIEYRDADYGGFNFKDHKYERDLQKAMRDALPDKGYTVSVTW